MISVLAHSLLRLSSCRVMVRLLCATGLLVATAEAHAATLTWSAADAARLRAAADACTGGMYRQQHNGSFVLRSARDITARLPGPGDDATVRPNEDYAHDLYYLALGLLRPALADPARALDGQKPLFLTCPAEPALGARLMAYLVGDGAGTRVGPSNAVYWLAQAYRQGIGVPRDPAHARSLFLQTRILGQRQLTAEDWGERPSDRLEDVLRQPQARAMLVAAAEAKNSSAQLLLAEQVMTTEPSRALALLEAAASTGDFWATRRLAQVKVDGQLGPRDPAGAVVLLAPFAQTGNDTYKEMLAAAAAYNAPVAGVPNATTLDDLGGKRLLPKPGDVEFDSLVGRMPARGLLAPDGRIVFVELPDPRLIPLSLGKATLWTYKPDRLAKLSPYVVDGRPVFAWIQLPTINWR